MSMNASNRESEQNEIPDWANPELVYEKARRLESIPFVLIPATPVTAESLARIRDLEQSIRDADARNQPFRLNLTSTVLKTPLVGGWPVPAEEQEDSDIEIEYILAETEEEWFEWKRKVDEKRARKRANEATLTTTSIRKPKGAMIESKSSSQGSSGRDSQSSAKRYPLVDLLGNADGSYNASYSQIAAEAEWNDDSLDLAAQSTQMGQNKHQNEHNKLICTPPRQLISPPDSGLEFTVAAPFPEQKTPTRQRNTKSKAGLSSSENSIPRSASLHSVPLTPTSSKKPPGNLARLDTSPRVADLSSLSARKGKGPRVVLELNPAQFSSQLSQVEHSFPSPSTTQQLYGSQKNTVPVIQAAYEADDSYVQELDEQIQIADKQAEYLGNTFQRKGENPWDIGSQDEMGVSQQTRAIVDFVHGDLGDGYCDRSFQALAHPVFVDPYGD